MPTHTESGPISGVGKGFTVTVSTEKHPLALAYEITAVPAVTPVMTPDAGSMVATEVAVLLQVPPPDEHTFVIVLATHTSAGPVIAARELFTVTEAVL